MRAVSRWFRSYVDKHRNPKVVNLSDRDFRFWDRLLCVAAENDGTIPPLMDLKRLLNARLDYVKGGLERLLKAGLITSSSGGYEPHNWTKRQYKSDTSTERSQKFRQKRNVAKPLPKTDTDTDTDTEAESGSDKSDPPARAEAREGVGPGSLEEAPPDGGDDADEEPGVKYTAAFEAFWREYPNKTGKGAAFNSYRRAFKALGGQDKGTERIHAWLLHAVKAQAAIWKRKRIVGQYIPHASTWLNGARYGDDPIKAEIDRARGRAEAHPAAALPGEEFLSPATPKPDKRETLTADKRAGWWAPGDEEGR